MGYLYRFPEPEKWKVMYGRSLNLYRVFAVTLIWVVSTSIQFTQPATQPMKYYKHYVGKLLRNIDKMSFLQMRNGIIAANGCTKNIEKIVCTRICKCAKIWLYSLVVYSKYKKWYFSAFIMLLKFFERHQAGKIFYPFILTILP